MQVKVTYPTEALIRAFIRGLTFANDPDVQVTEPEELDGEWVVYVLVGEADEMP